MIKIKTLCGYVEHIEKMSVMQKSATLCQFKLLFLMHFSVIFVNNQVASTRNFEIFQ